MRYGKKGKFIEIPQTKSPQGETVTTRMKLCRRVYVTLKGKHNYHAGDKEELHMNGMERESRERDATSVHPILYKFPVFQMRRPQRE